MSQELQMTQRGIAIGIDLGTTHSCVAIWKNDNPKVIENGQGHMTTRSYVSFSDTEDTLVGDEAYNKAGRNIANTIYDAKRLIGRRFSDQCVQTDMKLWPFKVINDADDKPMIVVQHMGQRKEFFPEEISSMVLGKMRKIAETYHGSPIKNVVITVPAGFSDAQRQATKKAGEMAGLTVLRIINEPTAAAIAYGLDLKAGGNSKRNVIIFDWGGGTLDVSLLIMGNGAFDVKATSGDTHLGGEDLDNRIVNYCIKEFNKKHNNSFVADAKALRKAKAKCEEAKKVLSFSRTTDIEIDSWYHNTDFSTTITRAEFEKLNMDIFKKCMEPVKKCLKDAGMNITDVHDVVVVGGSSRIPKVQELLQEVFGGKELCKSINPDEAIACGAAVQAAISMGNGSEKLKHFSLLDIIPTSLGVDVRNGTTGAENFMQVVIPRNTRVPVLMKTTLTTRYDNQKDVKFAIYEGESTSTLKNNYLGEFTLQDIPPAPKRVPKFDVSFEVNEDGILNVSAEDMSTHQRKGIKIDYHRPKNNAGPSDRSSSPTRRKSFLCCFCGS